MCNMKSRREEIIQVNGDFMASAVRKFLYVFSFSQPLCETLWTSFWKVVCASSLTIFVMNHSCC